MHTSGLVVTLEAGAAGTVALQRLAKAGPFTPGDRLGLRVPVVLEAGDADSSRIWHDWAAALPGVRDVEVVFVNWDESAAREPVHA